MLCAATQGSRELQSCDYYLNTSFSCCQFRERERLEIKYEQNFLSLKVTCATSIKLKLAKTSYCFDQTYGVRKCKGLMENVRVLFKNCLLHPMSFVPIIPPRNTLNSSPWETLKDQSSLLPGWYVRVSIPGSDVTTVN